MNQRDICGRLARWSIALAKFDFEIEHKKGVEHIVPDALSRGFHEQVEEIEWVTMAIDLEAPEFQLEDYVELRNRCLEFKENLPDIKVERNHVFKRTNYAEGLAADIYNCWKLLVPNLLSERLISSAHNLAQAAHSGISKTLFKF